MTAVDTRSERRARRRGAAVNRTTELGLIVLVALIVVAAYTLASLGKSASLPVNLGPFLAIILGLFVIGNVALRALAPRADPVLLPIAGLLNGIGYVVIVRLNHHQAGLQAVWTMLGIGAFVGTLAVVRHVRDLERYRYLLGFGGVGLLLLPLLPGIGRTINGSRVWVHLGPLNFQPGEIAKVALLCFGASYLAEKGVVLAQGDRHLGPIPLPDLRALGPVALAWAMSIVIMIAGHELGMGLLYFTLFITMLVVATGRRRYLGAGVGLFSAAALLAYKTSPVLHERVTIWLDPWKTAQSSGYQIVQSTFAFGAGGISGTGLALGSPTRIPEVQTDFIFAAIGEELGFVGTVTILFAYLLIVSVGLRIAVRAEQPFDKLVAVGASAIFALQTFIIVGGVTRLLPLTGITLPFVSYGGSSLLTNYVLLALLLRISDTSARNALGLST
ncbi:MAG: cell shape-determining peptidoglycan glycosyltransferase RodA [Acidimicrobiales bacterium]